MGVIIGCLSIARRLLLYMSERRLFITVLKRF